MESKYSYEENEESVDPIEEARLLEKQGQGYICDFRSDTVKNPRTAWGLNYGDFHPILPEEANEDHYFLPKLLAGSEYAVSRINLANYRAFMNAYEDFENVSMIDGRYGTYGVAVGLDVKNVRLWKDLASLVENPLLSEEALFHVEREERQEAWDEWAEYEYRRGLEKKYNLETCPINTCTLRKIFENVAGWEKEDWVEGIGGGWSYIDVEKVVEGTPFDLLLKNGAIPLELDR